MQTMILHTNDRATDGSGFSGADNGFDKFICRVIGDVGRTDVGSTTQHENLGVQIGHTVNLHTALHEFDEIIRAGLAGFNRVFAGIHHKSAPFVERQQIARPFAEISHRHGVAP